MKYNKLGDGRKTSNHKDRHDTNGLLITRVLILPVDSVSTLVLFNTPISDVGGSCFIYVFCFYFHILVSNKITMSNDVGVV